MVTRKLFNLTDLTRAFTLCIYELSEVVLIVKYGKFMLIIVQIVSTMIKDLYNS